MSTFAVREVVEFRTQAEAEDYLKALPLGRNARTFKTEHGKWGVLHYAAKSDGQSAGKRGAA